MPKGTVYFVGLTIDPSQRWAVVRIPTGSRVCILDRSTGEPYCTHSFEQWHLSYWLQYKHASAELCPICDDLYRPEEQERADIIPFFLGARAPNKARERDLRRTQISLRVGRTSFPVYVSVKNEYLNTKAFYVESRPRPRVVLKLKANQLAGESEARFSTRVNEEMTKPYTKEIEAGANAGVPTFSKPFRDAGFIDVPLKSEPDATASPSGSAKYFERKYQEYAAVIDAILRNVLDEHGNVADGLPWSYPYENWPVMNFFRLYRAVRQRKGADTQAVPLSRDLGLRYRGINMLRLQKDASSTQRQQAPGRAPGINPFYLTAGQAKALGGSILPGATPIGLVFWKMSEDRHKTREQRMRDGFAISFTVYRVAEVQGPDFREKVSEVLSALATENYDARGRGGDTSASAEALLHHIRGRRGAPRIQEGVTTVPLFDPMQDVIAMPPRTAFRSEYYHTLFHELVHWTGHRSRLNRTSHAIHGDNKYSKEELAAEIGAYLLSQEAGIALPVRLNTINYIRDWVKMLKEKRFWLSTASRLAFQAFEYLLKDYFTEQQYVSDLEDVSVDDDDRDLVANSTAVIQSLESVRSDATLSSAALLWKRLDEVLQGKSWLFSAQLTVELWAEGAKARFELTEGQKWIDHATAYLKKQVRDVPKPAKAEIA